MANYLIGLDFGTSQTKVCILNKDTEIREFLKFNNGGYFLPSLITKKVDNTFSYGDESIKGQKYRYFKMAAAEDEDLIQITNENIDGDLEGEIDDFRKYSTDFDIKPEILVTLYLTYIYLYIKKKKELENQKQIGGLLGQLAGNTDNESHSFSVNLGIPTEWNNPKYLKRKIKFQSILLTSIKLGDFYKNLEQFVSEKQGELMNRISEINSQHVNDLVKHPKGDEYLQILLDQYNLSVFPESAAGLNFLLETNRLMDGRYATLDIGAGTSDLAIFEVINNSVNTFYCSESMSIASNDFYREYAKQFFDRKDVTFEEIKEIENLIRTGDEEEIDDDFFDNAWSDTRGYPNDVGIQFVIRKTFFRKYYKFLYRINSIEAIALRNQLNHQPIIIFGGGANIDGFDKGEYRFFRGTDPYGRRDCYFNAKPITDYVQQVDISNEEEEIEDLTNLLILALGLTYISQNEFNFNNLDEIEDFQQIQNNEDVYFYYDLQEAAYK